MLWGLLFRPSHLLRKQLRQLASSSMHLSSAAGVAVASLMKLGHKVVELQFASQRPEHFHLSSGRCEFNATRQAEDSGQSFITWIYTVRYILPVLGGALATAGLGYVRVMQLGGWIMLLTTVLMAVAEHLGWMCAQPQWCQLLWLPLPLIFALVHPTVMHAIFRWHGRHHRRRSSLGTVVSATYCGSAVLGECLGMLLPELGREIGSWVSAIGIAISLLFLGLSLTMQEEPEYSVPSRARMVRYFKIFAALVIFVVAVADSRPVVYQRELDYHLKGTAGLTGDAAARIWSPEVVKLTSLTTTCAVLVLGACALPRQLPVRPRIQAGILLEAAVSIGLAVVNCPLVALTSSAAIHAIYWAASVADGIATGLTMVAAYELMDLMADSSTRPIVIGIVFTVLGMANILGRLMLMAFSAWPTQNPVLRPQSGHAALFSVYHLAILMSLLLCSLYHQAISLRLASTMVPEDSEPEQEEIRPLVEDAADTDSSQGHQAPDNVRYSYSCTG